MTKDDVIRIAKEAGLLRAGEGWTEPHRWGATEVERFANLVAAHARETMIADGWRRCAHGQRTTQFCAQAEQARQEEREECAKECERMVMYPNAQCESAAHENVWKAAAAIRARGETK